MLQVRRSQQGGDSTEAASAVTPTALTTKASSTPKVTIKRAANGKVAIKVGKTYKLGAKTSAGKLSYKSSNKKVARVSSKGVVKAVKAGKAKIVVTAKNGSKKTRKNITVKVLSAKKYKAVKKVKAKASSKSLVPGETTKVKAVFTPSKPSNKNVIYSSSNTNVLTVSATGKVKAKKAGTAKITVKSCANAKKKSSVTIKVKTYQPKNRSTWAQRMKLPTDKQIKGYSAYERSPYLVCWPEFSGTTGFYEYAVDFKADTQPRGTYLSIGNWFMDMSSLQNRYASVSADAGATPGLGYAGFQVLGDGSKVAIMSIWKIYVTDSSGNTSVINAKRTYPSNPRVGGSFGGEGTGVQTIVNYDWKAGRTYRALIQCGQTSAGNCELFFWVCDLTTGVWTELVAYDLGYGSTYINDVCCFSENFLVDYAANIRTVEWSNFRVNSRATGSWVAAKSATMSCDYSMWPGSYNYGSNSSCFWAIATGIPNLCSPPANNKLFYVSKAAASQPY
ncbi:MAG: Ig-like domain-containing protein [Coriobacteriia bacterium]|nr:Ig-like domain-containing protein [Coriobacteriia bacterium]